MDNPAVYFTGVREVEVREDTRPSINEHQVLVQAISSLISSGTEMLFYNGLVRPEVPLDENIPVLAARSGYPFKYGYSIVGRIVECGKAVNPQWQGRIVFAFNPHQCYFAAEPENLIDIAGSTVDDAVFLANMETAVNFMMDGRPMIGERVMVFGQGVVGLLTTALLSRMPLYKLIAVDMHEARRKMSVACGAEACLDPQKSDFPELANRLLEGNRADLVYEITGDPRALEQAISLAGYGGRVVIGSWYGTKKARAALDSHFHRDRVKLISSQVSTIAPEYTGAWTKQRRLDVAKEMTKGINPARMITHRIPIKDAGKAYRLLAEQPDQTIGVVLTY